MRARYAAFVQRDYDFLQATETHPEPMDEETKAWLDSLSWKRLEVIEAVGNEVEFGAFYLEAGVPYCLHERSRFVQDDAGKWLYDQGETKRIQLSLGRNDACLCGSGKKFKKCCGA